MNNELIKLIDHCHNIFTDILFKYHNGIDLSEEDEEIISEFYISYEMNKIKYLDNQEYIYRDSKFIQTKRKVILNKNLNNGKVEIEQGAI